MNETTYIRVIAVVVLLSVVTAGLAAPVAGSPTTATPDNGDDDEEDDDDDPVINIDLDAVTEAIEDLADAFEEFTNGWDDTLTKVLLAVLFKPFRTLAQQLLNVIVVVLTTTPQVYPNPPIERIHGQVLIVAYMLSGIAFMAAGILYMVGPILGISYREIRPVLPRIIAALVFGTVSLPLLQLGVDLSNALTTAFQPNQLSMSLQQLAGLSTGLVIAWVVESVVLLAVVVLFLLRDVYILFVAAISPLLAVMWSLPRVKRYADTFIAGWFAALLMAPLDVLVLRFSMALLQGSGTSALQSVSNWVFGVASFTLLLLVPYQLWTASQSAVGMAYNVANGVKGRIRGTQQQRRFDPSDRRSRQHRRRRRGRDSLAGRRSHDD